MCKRVLLDACAEYKLKKLWLSYAKKDHKMLAMVLSHRRHLEVDDIQKILSLVTVKLHILPDIKHG